jgi:hypothetical protein
MYAIVIGCKSTLSEKNATGYGYGYSSRQMPRAGIFSGVFTIEDSRD